MAWKIFKKISSAYAKLKAYDLALRQENAAQFLDDKRFMDNSTINSTTTDNRSAQSDSSVPAPFFDDSSSISTTDMNNATSLPMSGSTDIAGNSFGTTSSDSFSSSFDNTFSSGSSFDNSFSSSSSFDDPFRNY